MPKEPTKAKLDFLNRGGRPVASDGLIERDLFALAAWKWSRDLRAAGELDTFGLVPGSVELAADVLANDYEALHRHFSEEVAKGIMTADDIVQEMKNAIVRDPPGDER